MEKRMSLEDYKKKVENYLKSSKVESKLIKSWMKAYEKDIQEAYKNSWKVEEIAIPMILGY